MEGSSRKEQAARDTRCSRKVESNVKRSGERYTDLLNCGKEGMAGVRKKEGGSIQVMTCIGRGRFRDRVVNQQHRKKKEIEQRAWRR